MGKGLGLNWVKLFYPLVYRRTGSENSLGGISAVILIGILSLPMHVIVSAQCGLGQSANSCVTVTANSCVTVTWG